MIRSLLASSAILLALTTLARAEVWVYPAPSEQLRSAEYRVSVTQNGRTESSFVYADHNPDKKLVDKMSDWNHWTTFSFSGPVTVEVERLHGKADGTEIRPSARGIKPACSDNKVSFSLDKPAKLWVKFPGAEEHPLFVFADAPEQNIPDRKDPNVLWFEAGKVHTIGEKYQLKSGQTVYIAGGAYVKGTLTGKNLSNITIRGRGVLSGIDMPRKAGASSIPWNMVQLDGPGENQLVDGITVTNPSHFCVLSRGTLVARNLKLFGWWHQTDGWGGGDNSIVEDTFMKVNDDNVKFYATGQIARDLVIYQQMNGAVFQFGWSGAGQNGKNCVADNIDIITSETAHKSKEANQPIINLRSQNAQSELANNLFTRIRIEGDTAMLVGFSSARGSTRGLILRDIHISGRILYPNFLRTEGSGSIEGVQIENVRTADGPFNKDTAKWGITGNVKPVTYAP